MKAIVILMISVLSLTSFAQEKKPEVIIQTSAECGMCKDKLEGKLNYTKGIVFSELNVETKQLTVKFLSKKISLDEIKQIISELGYDADEVKANPLSVEKLPACCQPGGMDK